MASGGLDLYAGGCTPALASSAAIRRSRSPRIRRSASIPARSSAMRCSYLLLVLLPLLMLPDMGLHAALGEEDAGCSALRLPSEAPPLDSSSRF